MLKPPIYDMSGLPVRRDDDVPGFTVGPDGEPVRNPLAVALGDTPGFLLTSENSVPGFRIGSDGQPRFRSAPVMPVSLPRDPLDPDLQGVQDPPNWSVIGPPPDSLREKERWVPFYLQIPGMPYPALPSRERQWPKPGWP